MIILATDDERHALEALTEAIREAAPKAEVHGFRKATEALEFASQSRCDIAFLDIEMREMSGIELAKRLKQTNLMINIVFVTGYGNYMGDAFQMYASGYLMKPATRESIARELENLRHPLLPSADGRRVRVQAFGNFEVFVDGKPMKFQYNKTKELLAYLIDRKGAFCTNGEIIGILWEDSLDTVRRSSHFRNLCADLISAFHQSGCDGALIRERGKLAVVPENIICDYFDWEKGEPYALNAYKGEYMAQYSWGELTHGAIEGVFKK